MTVTKEGKQTVASAEELNEFGVGENQTEATADLQKSIADLYFTLKENQEHLSKGLQKVWDTLQSKIALQ